VGLNSQVAYEHLCFHHYAYEKLGREFVGCWCQALLFDIIFKWYRTLYRLFLAPKFVKFLLCLMLINICFVFTLLLIQFISQVS